MAHANNLSAAHTFYKLPLIIQITFGSFKLANRMVLKAFHYTFKGFHCKQNHFSLRINNMLFKQGPCDFRSLSLNQHLESIVFSCSFVLFVINHIATPQRSEERRVGKECRSRWS